MDTVKFQNPIPIKAIPEQHLDMILAEFSVYLSNLLSLNDLQSKERLKYALPSIKKLCWSMGLPEIKKMFEMYADGELGLQPRSNYFDRILVGNIFNAYKAIEKSRVVKKEETPVELSDDQKEIYAFETCIISFDKYVQDKILSKSFWVVYDELDSRGIIKYDDREKKEMYAIIREQYPTENKGYWVEKSKVRLLERFYDKLITKGKHIKELL